MTPPTWTYRMVGGPYDGSEARETVEVPQRSWFYAGLPNSWSEPPSATTFMEEEGRMPKMSRRFWRLEYRILAIVEESHRHLALYVFTGFDTLVRGPFS